ncbi:hypothetical protein [Myxococcus llanfairpwllgwyngyllgogerychwyrndrobwllllantysiliogogogochensis]|uniref:hypothetical protein n=1 Tax=Myxococcus llanfairpwllgwyngyllgogerychwyrndrobwllllantysiliogogogochensis TaxID=2590453 RepID=UPI001FE9B0D6|nr:hypothetical protein [Myxococcus llanfairpwllgwyngyllgogerychwyrndrobwllllantysiliogogogochensis]
MVAGSCAMLAENPNVTPVASPNATLVESPSVMLVESPSAMLVESPSVMPVESPSAMPVESPNVTLAANRSAMLVANLSATLALGPRMEATPAWTVAVVLTPWMRAEPMLGRMVVLRMVAWTQARMRGPSRCRRMAARSSRARCPGR